MRVLVVEDERKMADLLRRGLREAGFAVDLAGRRVWRGDTEISLSRTEFALLEVLMRSPDRVLSRFDLLEHVWDEEYENRSNVVDTYVRYLRNKVDRPFGVESIETVRGHGYRIRAVSAR